MPKISGSKNFRAEKFSLKIITSKIPRKHSGANIFRRTKFDNFGQKNIRPKIFEKKI